MCPWARHLTLICYTFHCTYTLWQLNICFSDFSPSPPLLSLHPWTSVSLWGWGSPQEHPIQSGTRKRCCRRRYWPPDLYGPSSGIQQRQCGNKTKKDKKRRKDSEKGPNVATYIVVSVVKHKQNKNGTCWHTPKAGTPILIYYLPACDPLFITSPKRKHFYFTQRLHQTSYKVSFYLDCVGANARWGVSN
jgi:hypothetical protein